MILERNRGLRGVTQILRKIADILFSRFHIACDLNSRKYKRLEARSRSYTLPDPLVMIDGSRVENQMTWKLQRRGEILELFRTHVYGHTPIQTEDIHHRIISVDEQALNGAATRKEVFIAFGEKPSCPLMTLLIYLPNKLKKGGIKAPIFMGLNFFGNHTVHKDPKLTLSTNWIPNNHITLGRPPEMLRGIQSSSWPIEFIINKGYGLATAYCGDIVPDRADGLVLSILNRFEDNESKIMTADSWGAIGGWAWGLSRAIDYLERDPDIDRRKIAVIGHSRLGKAALWAGAQDERIAISISNESGCGGAALTRNKLGETVSQINHNFPHWFCNNFKQYNNKEADLPVDQHELISLIAPRPIYIASAQLDIHADPMGEFLAAKNANPVFRMLGTEGFPSDVFPGINKAVMGTIGYHMRSGRHGITQYDWRQFILFADKHFWK